jgi:broad specificity phosphatase PhoE
MAGKTAELIFVRHSVVTVEPSVPSHLWSLSDEGKSRCLRLAGLLRQLRPSLYVTSREPKAIETGRLLADAAGVLWVAADDLHEQDRQGVSHTTTEAEFQQSVVRLFQEPNRLVFGRETACQARARFAEAVTRVLGQHPSERIAIVSHGTVLTLHLCHHNPSLDAIPFWRSLTLPCAIRVSLPEFKIIDRFDVDKAP